MCCLRAGLAWPCRRTNASSGSDGTVQYVVLLPGTSTSKYLPGPVALRLRLRGHPVLVGPKAVLATWEADLCARAPLAGEGAGPAEAVAWQSVATASFARAELGPGSTYSPHVAAALRGNKGTWMFAELYQSMSSDQAGAQAPSVREG